MNSNKKNHVVFLGETGFPHGLGSIQRLILMAKAFLSANLKVTVICRKGNFRQSDNPEIKKNGTFEGIEYLYTSKNIFRPSNFFARNFQKVIGMYGEFNYLKNLKKNNDIAAAIVSSLNAMHLLRYWVYTRLLGIPLILNFVELASSMRQRNGFFTKLNDYIFDYWFIKLSDAAFPISEKLIQYYQKMSPSKPILKLPILCDFHKFEVNKSRGMSTKFLFCGDASYFDVIEFIIDSFELLRSKDKTLILELILGGNSSDLENIRNRINRSTVKSNIKLITNVDHKDIPMYYAQASALLIPLRPIVQDEARFPHKIGEYLASGRPLITTMIGEIKNYGFKDQETALIALEYKQEKYAEKMDYVVENPQKAIEIGAKGKIMGKECFDYRVFGTPMKNFIYTLNK